MLFDNKVFCVEIFTVSNVFHYMRVRCSLDTQHIYILLVCVFSFPFFSACFDFSFVNGVSVHCSRSHKFHNNFFIKNWSHNTIHTFKNYFVTVFSVFSFQFQQNKSYPNRPLVVWKISLK